MLVMAKKRLVSAHGKRNTIAAQHSLAQQLENSHPAAAAAAAASPADRPAAPVGADAPTKPPPATPPPRDDPAGPPAPDAELSMNMFTALSREKAFACG